MEAILAFLVGVSIVLIILVIIKVVQFETVLNSIKSDHDVLENTYAGLIDEIDKNSKGFEDLTKKYFELHDQNSEDYNEFEDRLTDLVDDVDEIHSDICELKDLIDLQNNKIKKRKKR
tara:strand:- start:288 stop:641 length:354 start_codon:yes stop_codon:yes gene_type:complete